MPPTVTHTSPTSTHEQHADRRQQHHEHGRHERHHYDNPATYVRRPRPGRLYVTVSAAVDRDEPEAGLLPARAESGQLGAGQGDGQARGRKAVGDVQRRLDSLEKGKISVQCATGVRGTLGEFRGSSAAVGAPIPRSVERSMVPRLIEQPDLLIVVGRSAPRVLAARRLHHLRLRGHAPPRRMAPRTERVTWHRMSGRTCAAAVATQAFAVTLLSQELRQPATTRHRRPAPTAAGGTVGAEEAHRIFACERRVRAEDWVSRSVARPRGNGVIGGRALKPSARRGRSGRRGGRRRGAGGPGRSRGRGRRHDHRGRSGGRRRGGRVAVDAAVVVGRDADLLVSVAAVALNSVASVFVQLRSRCPNWTL